MTAPSSARSPGCRPPSTPICSARRSPRRCPRLSGPAWVAAIDDDLADTAAFTEAYGVPPEASANCVVVAARRAGQTTLAACLVLATTRADVNGLVRRHLGARKASFAPQDVAVAESGMAYGGITPVGLPAAWPVLVDAGGRGRGPRRDRLGHPRQQARGAPVAARRAAGAPWCSTGSGSRCRADGRAAPAPRRPPPVAGPRRQRRRLGRAAADPDDDDRRYLEDRPPHWGSD